MKKKSPIQILGYAIVAIAIVICTYQLGTAIGYARQMVEAESWVQANESLRAKL